MYHHIQSFTCENLLYIHPNLYKSAMLFFRILIWNTRLLFIISSSSTFRSVDNTLEPWKKNDFLLLQEWADSLHAAPHLLGKRKSIPSPIRRYSAQKITSFFGMRIQEKHTVCITRMVACDYYCHGIIIKYDNTAINYSRSCRRNN